MRKLILVVFALTFIQYGKSQDSITVKIKNQYKADAKDIVVSLNGNPIIVNEKSFITIPKNLVQTFDVSGKDYVASKFSIANADKDNVITINKTFTWKDLLTPMFYIIFGGLWFVVFVIFAETGLFAGFFLPGDSLLFVAGIYSFDLVKSGVGMDAGAFMNLIILGIIISIAGIIGNFVGYWFGRKSGPFLFERKDTFFFRKKYLFQAKDFYEKHGGGAIVMARFLPIVRTFAPIVAGIVGMEKKKFTFYNIVGCVSWVFAMLFAGHYLQELFLHKFQFDLREHLELIVIGIVLVTTAPVIIKLIFGKSKSQEEKKD
jgi:membrane-associated protein